MEALWNLGSCNNLSYNLGRDLKLTSIYSKSRTMRILIIVWYSNPALLYFLQFLTQKLKKIKLFLNKKKLFLENVLLNHVR